MTVFIRVLTTALSLLAVSARADDYSIERRCFDRIAREWEVVHHAPCGSCSALWKDVVRCAAPTEIPTVSKGTIEWCINTTETAAKGKPMSFDRVGAAFAQCGKAR